MQVHSPPQPRGTKATRLLEKVAYQARAEQAEPNLTTAPLRQLQAELARGQRRQAEIKATCTAEQWQTREIPEHAEVSYLDDYCGRLTFEIGQRKGSTRDELFAARCDQTLAIDRQAKRIRSRKVLPPRRIGRTAPRARGAGRPRAAASRSSSRSGDSGSDSDGSSDGAEGPSPRPRRLTYGLAGFLAEIAPQGEICDPTVPPVLFDLREAGFEVAPRLDAEGVWECGCPSCWHHGHRDVDDRPLRIWQPEIHGPWQYSCMRGCGWTEIHYLIAERIMDRSVNVELAGVA